MTPRRSLTALLVPLALLAAAGLARAHSERQIVSPIRPGPIPNPNRISAHTLVVCKPSSMPTRAEHQDIHQRLATATGAALLQAQAEEAAWHRNNRLFRKCRFEHIQEAVFTAKSDTTIYILPGVYREEPSRAAPTSTHGNNGDGTYSYQYHLENPNDASLIAVLGQVDITLEGTGVNPRDVLIDAGFVKDVVIRADRCTGFIVRNLWARDANEHGIYVVDSDGYIFDRTVGSWSHDYELFSFASDNGLYTDCEAEGGSDSGIYVGGAPDTHTLGRFSATVQRCKMYHNALGYSGTQGNSVRMVDNDVYDNAIGISFDSEFDHPNFPQRYATIENNRIHDNNFDIYASTSDLPPGGPAYDFFRYPVGTGIWIIGGDNNTIQGNYLYNNQKFGVLIAGNPLEVDPNGILPSPGVNRNTVKDNHVGVDPQGALLPNATGLPPGGNYAPGGSDFLWDETGNDNCWGSQAPDSGAIITDPPNVDHPAGMPGPCPFANTGPGLTLTKLGLLSSCFLVADPPNRPHTADLFYPCPFGQTNNGPYRSRDEAECGNGTVDLGEDCDAGNGGYGGGAISQTCDEIGQGSGSLACDDFCQYDTSGCAAQSCGRYGSALLRLNKLGAPAGDDELDVVLSDIDGTGRAFDPSTEEVSLMFRADPEPPAPSTLFYSRTIPAGAGWTATPTSYIFADPVPGPNALRIQLTTKGSFAGPFKGVGRLRGAGLASAVGTRTGTVVFRIGNDCWRGELPCNFSKSGHGGKCRKAKKP